MHEGAAALAADGSILYANRSLSRMLGIPHERLRGMTLAGFLGEPGRRQLERLFGRLPRRGALVKTEARSASGRWFPVQLSASPLPPQAAEGGCVVIVTDLTPLKQREEAADAERVASERARRMETVVVIGRRALAGDRLQQIMEAAAEQVAQALDAELAWVIELLPGGAGLRLRAGSAAVRECAGRQSPAAGRSQSHAGFTMAVGQAVAVDDLSREERFDASALRSLGAASGVCVPIADQEGSFGVLAAYSRSLRRFTRDDVFFLESVANVLAAAIRRDRSEAALRVSEACFRETLEQKVAERTAVAEIRAAQLRELAAQLTRAEQRERRRLAQTLHDHLQQLLVALRLKLGRALARLDLESPRAALEQSDDLLEQALQASRELTVDLSPPVLYEAGLVSALEWLARQMQDKHGLEVSLTAERDVEPVSEEVRIFLFHSVRELLFNAVKHAGVSRAQVALRRAGEDRLEVSVADEGKGFDLEEAARRPSSGFGLFSLRERLEFLGGRLSLDTAPGRGTRVALEAPLHLPQEALRAASEALQTIAPYAGAAEAAETAAGKIRVLLADDHTILRQGLRALLNNEPDMQAVAEATNGEEAVVLASRLRPDVIVMDVSMPRINGIEATRRIKIDVPQAIVVALSMYESEDMAAAMRAAGASAYLSKDKASEALTGVIRAEVLGRR